VNQRAQAISAQLRSATLNGRLGDPSPCHLAFESREADTDGEIA
jgi:hypothetical protein